MSRKKAEPTEAPEQDAPEPTLHEQLNRPEPAEATKPLTSRRARRIAEGETNAE